MTAEEIIKKLGLQPHPEGGWYKETYRHMSVDGARGSSTAIFYLLKAGEKSHWHRVIDADEIWHWHAGCALKLRRSADGISEDTLILGNDLIADELPQGVIKANHWQAAEPVGRDAGDWVLVGCTVAPAFEFASFDMAPAGWEPGQ